LQKFRRLYFECLNQVSFKFFSSWLQVRCWSAIFGSICSYGLFPTPAVRCLCSFCRLKASKDFRKTNPGLEVLPRPNIFSKVRDLILRSLVLVQEVSTGMCRPAMSKQRLNMIRLTKYYEFSEATILIITIPSNTVGFCCLISQLVSQSGFISWFLTGSLPYSMGECSLFYFENIRVCFRTFFQ